MNVEAIREKVRALRKLADELEAAIKPPVEEEDIVIVEDETVLGMPPGHPMTPIMLKHETDFQAAILEALDKALKNG